jgi:N-methylhydantoinase B
MGLQEIPEGDALVLELPGGAGHGDPRERDPRAIQQDIENGYVSSAAADCDYGAPRKAEAAFVRELTGVK